MIKVNWFISIFKVENRKKYYNKKSQIAPTLLTEIKLN